MNFTEEVIYRPNGSARASHTADIYHRFRKLLTMNYYTLPEAWSGVNLADLMAAQGAFGTNFYDRSILRPKRCACYRPGRPVIKIGPKGALGSHEIRPIHSAPSLGQSIGDYVA